MGAVLTERVIRLDESTHRIDESLKVVVRGISKNRIGAALLLRKAYADNVTELELPGGKIEPTDRSLEEGLEREIGQETGKKLIAINHRVVTIVYNSRNGTPSAQHIYLVELSDDKLKISDEHVGSKEITRKDLSDSEIKEKSRIGLQVHWGLIRI